MGQLPHSTESVSSSAKILTIFETIAPKICSNFEGCFYWACNSNCTILGDRNRFRG